MSASFDNAILDDLNSAQQEAVKHRGGPLLILAGAGSGKTRVLTQRIAWLVHQEGVSPDRILALTFTNKAAGEMAERIEALLQLPVRGLWIGTFHSICLRWLRRHASAAGYQPGLSVFDTDDQRALMRRLLKEEGFEEKPRRARDVLGIISRAKTAGQGPEEMLAAAHTPAQKISARIYAAYQETLRRQNALDFDDLLLVTQQLFVAHPEIAAQYAERFQHVLVDEYQDTNRIQFRLVECLAHRHRSIFVVGDDDQSIYGWRGADVTNIIDFREHFPDATVLRLEQNYRSTGSILAVANAVIRQNESRWAKQLWTQREDGPKPDLVIAADEDEEAEEIARRVADTVAAEQGRYGHIALFYRTHAQSRPLEDAFLRSSIPYQLIGGVYFYQRKEVKDLLSYLRVLVNPLDEVNLRRALSVPRRGIGETTVAALLQEARQRAADPLEIAALGQLERARGKARENLRAFGAMLTGWRQRVGEPPELILSEIIVDTDFKRYLQEQGGDWEERVANVDELLEGARLFSGTHGGGVAQYLDLVSLLTSADSHERKGDCVTLMTAHNAKGLEFPRVFVTGLEEGLFPHVSAFDDQAEMEEERRLFYVACTRAMQQLTLSGCLRRRRIMAAAGGLSRFVSELDPSLYEESELHTVSWTPRGGGSRHRSLWDAPASSTGHRSTHWPEQAKEANRPIPDGGAQTFGVESFDALDHPLVGRRVFHATFGSGLVVAADGEGPRARVTVRFNSGRMRKVLGGYLEWEA